MWPFGLSYKKRRKWCGLWTLAITVLGPGQGVLLTRRHGFARQGEDVIFMVFSEEASSGIQNKFHTNLTTAIISISFSSNRCQNYTFTVFSENGFSLSISGVTQSMILPTSRCICH